MVLSAYQGTLLFISHDRYFLNKVANKIFEFTETGIKEYLGNYDDYTKAKEEQRERKRLASDKETITKTEKQRIKKKKNKEKRALNKLKSEIAALEREINACEERIGVLEEMMSADDFYDDKSAADERIAEYDMCVKNLEQMMNEWEEMTINYEAKIDDT